MKTESSAITVEKLCAVSGEYIQRNGIEFTMDNSNRALEQLLQCP